MIQRTPLLPKRTNSDSLLGKRKDVEKEQGEESSALFASSSQPAEKKLKPNEISLEQVCDAIKSDRLDVVESFFSSPQMRHRIDITTSENHPLILAVKCGKYNIVLFLLSLNHAQMTKDSKVKVEIEIDFHFKSCDENLLYLAVEAKSAELVQYFLNIGIKPIHKRAIINLAAKNGDFLTVKCLLDSGYFKSKDLKYLLCWATQSGNLELVQFVIQRTKLHPNDSQGPEGCHVSPLNIAAYWGHRAVINYFIRDCNANTNNKDFWSHVVRRGDLEFVRDLIENKKCNPSNATAVCYAAAKYGHLSLVKYLIKKYHFDVTKTDKNDSTLLHYAVRSQNIELVQFLVKEKRFSVNTLNANQMISLFDDALFYSYESTPKLGLYFTEKSTDFDDGYSKLELLTPSKLGIIFFLLSEVEDCSPIYNKPEFPEIVRRVLSILVQINPIDRAKCLDKTPYKLLQRLSSTKNSENTDIIIKDIAELMNNISIVNGLATFVYKSNLKLFLEILAELGIGLPGAIKLLHDAPEKHALKNDEKALAMASILINLPADMLLKIQEHEFKRQLLLHTFAQPFLQIFASQPAYFNRLKECIKIELLKEQQEPFLAPGAKNSRLLTSKQLDCLIAYYKMKFT